MSDKNGGPAFPTEGVVCRDGILYEGMTLRDYFAAKAMQGFVTSLGIVHGTVPTDEDIARYSYALADAMLKEREE